MGACAGRWARSEIQAIEILASKAADCAAARRWAKKHDMVPQKCHGITRDGKQAFRVRVADPRRFDCFRFGSWQNGVRFVLGGTV